MILMSGGGPYWGDPSHFDPFKQLTTLVNLTVAVESIQEATCSAIRVLVNIEPSSVWLCVLCVLGLILLFHFLQRIAHFASLIRQNNDAGCHFVLCLDVSDINNMWETKLVQDIQEWVHSMLKLGASSFTQGFGLLASNVKTAMCSFYRKFRSTQRSSFRRNPKQRPLNTRGTKQGLSTMQTQGIYEIERPHEEAIVEEKMPLYFQQRDLDKYEVLHTRFDLYKNDEVESYFTFEQYINALEGTGLSQYEILTGKQKNTADGSDGGGRSHGNSRGGPAKTNSDPEKAYLTAPEKKSDHSNESPSKGENPKEIPQTPLDGRNGETQRRGDSGEDSSETNADPEDPPPSPPEEESERSTDLFSSATNKEASQVFLFLRFSLKRDSSRRYKSELHLDPGLKYPRRGYDFEALDPKAFPFEDYSPRIRPPLHDVTTAPFPTTGAHLLATVKARMHYEAFRLGTFVHMNADHPCCLRLANAGFFYTFQGRMVQCYSCGLRWDDWQPEQDFYREHERRRPECLHVQGKDSSNVPIHEVQSRFRAGTDITGENIDKSSSVRDMLRTSTANLKRAFQPMEAERRKLEHSANLTLGETLIAHICSTATLNNLNKNAVGTHNFSAGLPRTTCSQGRPGPSNTEESLHYSGSIIRANDGEKEQGRPSERQVHDGGALLSVAATLQHGDRFSSKPRTPLPQVETVKTYAPPIFNSTSSNSSNNNENDNNDDDNDDSNYNVIITNSNAGGAAKEIQSSAMTRPFPTSLLDGTKAQSVAERVTDQHRQEETSGKGRAQLPRPSSDSSVQARPPETPTFQDQRNRSADGRGLPAFVLPNRRPENLSEPRDVQDCRRELAPKVPVINGKQYEVIGHRLAQNSDQHQSTTSRGRHQSVPSPDNLVYDVNDIEDDTSLFAPPNEVPGSTSGMAGARAAKISPAASSDQITHLCNGAAEAHALGQHATSNRGSMTETAQPEHRVEATTARSSHAQNSDQPTKSGGAIPKTTSKQLTSGLTIDSREQVATKPTASERDGTPRNVDVRSSTPQTGKYGAGEDKIINSERRQDTDDSGSSRPYLNGEVHARTRRLNSAGAPNPAGTHNRNSLFATGQLMNSPVNSRPAAVVNEISHSTSAVSGNLPPSRQNGHQDASQEELRRRESNVQNRERPLVEIQRQLPERGNRDFTAASLTSSTSSTPLSASVVATENPTRPLPSPVQRSELPTGVTISVNEAGQAQGVGRQERQLLPGHDSGISNGVTSSGIEAGQTSGTGQLRDQSSGLPNRETASLSEGSRRPGQISGIPNGISNGTTTSSVEGSQRFNVLHREEYPTSAQSSGVPNGIASAEERSHRLNVSQQDHQRTSTRASTSTSQAPLFPETEADRASIRPGWTPDYSGETSGYQTLPSGHDSSFSRNTNQTISDRPEVLVYNVAEANRPSLSSVSDRPSSQDQASASPASGYDASKALYPRYTERSKRLESFVHWPHLHQDPEELVDAGFFFAGPPDCVRCFHCGLGLKDWEAEDDPYEEHGRWRATCAYLVFFQEEEIRTRREALRENRPVGSVFHVHANRGGQGPTAAQTNLAVSTLPARATPSGFQGEDWLSSAAAQQARDMGFLDDAIQYAIVALLATRAGRRAITPQNLVQAILYIRERNQTGLVANNGNDDGSSDDDITEGFFVSDNDDSDDDGDDLRAETAAAGGAGEDPASKTNKNVVIYNSRMTKNELKQLEAENKELEERMRCKVCLDSKASVLFLPCRHRVCCVDCAARLRKCPMCRKNIRGSVPIAPTT